MTGVAGESAIDPTFHQRWSVSAPPFRPGPHVAAAVEALLPAPDGDTLLLGVTPELAALDRPILAVDRDAATIARAWPGDSARRRVMVGDWRSLPVASPITAAMGDGSLSQLAYPGEQRLLFGQLAALIRPGGRAVFRCFAPRSHPTLQHARALALEGSLPFHAFKLMFNMAVAGLHADRTVACSELLAQFDALFPDRAALSHASGWPLAVIAEMDAYRGVGAVQSYACRAELIAMLAPDFAVARFEDTHGYPGAELCPLLVVGFA